MTCLNNDWASDPVYKGIKEIIAEHNKIWGDIESRHPRNGYPKGFHCWNLKDDQIIVIVAGLRRKGLVK